LVLEGEVLLKAERGSDVVDRHAEQLAEREDDGERVGLGQARHLVDRKLAEEGARDVGRERRAPRRGVLLIAHLHLAHRAPHVRDDFVEARRLDFDARRGDARRERGAHRGWDLRRNVRRRRGAEGQLRRGRHLELRSSGESESRRA
jgi:hypothetical protein